MGFRIGAVLTKKSMAHISHELIFWLVNINLNLIRFTYSKFINDRRITSYLTYFNFISLKYHNNFKALRYRAS